MSRTRRIRLVAMLPAVLGAALLAAGCDSSTTVDIGAIRVVVTATGNNLDADGYVIRVTGNGEDQSQAVEVNDLVLFAVPSGMYTVELTDKADNCVVDVNPQVAQVSSGETTELQFNTLCG